MDNDPARLGAVVLSDFSSLEGHVDKSVNTWVVSDRGRAGQSR
jgi:hypothetical protein